jgi:hypothetical protein
MWWLRRAIGAIVEACGPVDATAAPSLRANGLGVGGFDASTATTLAAFAAARMHATTRTRLVALHCLAQALEPGQAGLHVGSRLAVAPAAARRLAGQSTGRIVVVVGAVRTVVVIVDGVVVVTAKRQILTG